MEIQFGIETEIGITRSKAEDLDVVAESIQLVRSTTAPGVRMRWDYRLEDPHQDARGFRVKELRQDTDEANYFAQDASRPLSFTEIKSDLAIRNGARFYNDHAHPEYCTPECSTLLEILQQDYAGDELLMACAQTVCAGSDNPVMLYKNNTDFRGHSYGCHENYLLPRRLPWSVLSAGIQSFLTTRQILAGAGKFGWEEEDSFVRAGFQISQRSDFFSELQSVDTMQRRPLINTRDEPHADPTKFRRFHVIVGDANLSPFATYLKIGTTAIVLQALHNGAPLERIPRLLDPLRTLRDISRDRAWRWECQLGGGKVATAIEIQRIYLELVKEFAPPENRDWEALVEAWESCLDDLEKDPLLTADRLDWTAKFRLIDQFRAAENLSEDDPWLRSLDLSYHHLDREQGLFFGLLDQGSFRVPYPMKEISGNDLKPPASTRAAVRGSCIERFGPQVELAQWDGLVLNNGSIRLELDLRDLFDQSLITAAVTTIERARGIEDLLVLPIAKRL